MFGRIDIGRDFTGVGHVVVGECVGIGYTQNLEPEDAGHLLQIEEVGIGVLGVPGIVVEDRVVNAVGSPGTDVGGRDTCMLEEGSEVGARTEVAHTDLFAIFGRRVGGAVLVAHGT